MGSSALGSAMACGNQNEIGCKLRGPLGWYEQLGRKPAEHVRQRFLNWIDGLDTGRPFFAFLNLFDAHTPYLPPSPYDTAFGGKSSRGNAMHLERKDWEWTPDQVRAEQNAYDGAIAYMDEVIGNLLEDLERRGQLSNTLVVITSDHGEEFMEHGVMTHGNSLYSPSLHIPLVLLQPGRVPAGLRLTEPVSIRDLPATICEFVGVGATFAGASLSRYWQASPAPTEPLYAQVSGRGFRPAHYPVSKGDMHSVISGDWHYIRRGDGQLELFDLRADPWEKSERAATETGVADSLGKLLSALGANH
jgi:arylsulfatase A-like enzyme